jgi:hypothetical protein
VHVDNSSGSPGFLLGFAIDLMCRKPGLPSYIGLLQLARLAWLAFITGDCSATRGEVKRLLMLS